MISCSKVSKEFDTRIEGTYAGSDGLDMLSHVRHLYRHDRRLLTVALELLLGIVGRQDTVLVDQDSTTG